jgi:hypothetical protein
MASETPFLVYIYSFHAVTIPFVEGVFAENVDYAAVSAPPLPSSLREARGGANSGEFQIARLLACVVYA